VDRRPKTRTITTLSRAGVQPGNIYADLAPSRRERPQREELLVRVGPAVKPGDAPKGGWLMSRVPIAPKNYPGQVSTS
jgi:hypothetical protein